MTIKPLILVFLLLDLTLAAAGVPTRLVEDFTTTDMMDPDSTTAVWDTAAGEVRLPEMTPSIVGTYNTPGQARDVVLRGGLAYVADGAGGLRVLDVSDPALPVQLGAITFGDYAMKLRLEGDVAYVAAYGAGLQVVDVSDPAAPASLGSYAAPGTCYDLDVKGDLLYLCAKDYGLVILDVTDPATPTLAGVVSGYTNCYGIEADWPYVYLLGQDTNDASADLHVIDARDPAACVEVGEAATSGQATGIFLTGPLAYVADSSGGLRVFDVTDPAAPAQIGACTTISVANDVVVAGDVACVADFYDGLILLDVTDPTAPTELLSLDTTGQGYGCAFAGELIYLADGTSGLRAVMPWTWGEPVITARIVDDSVPDTDFYWDVWPRGDVAYIRRVDATADWPDWVYTGALDVVDMSDPGAPVNVRSLEFSSGQNLRDMDWSGDAGWLAVGTYLYAVDLSKPLSPALVSGGVYNLAATVTSIDVVGPLIYATLDDDGLAVVDASDPTAVSVVGTLDTPGTALDVVVDGDLAYVADGSGGLLVVDVADPANPSLTATFSTGGSVEGLAVDGHRVCCAGSELLICDVTAPATPTLLYQGNGYTREVAVDWPLVYAANDTLSTSVTSTRRSYYTLDATVPSAPVVVARTWVSGAVSGLAPYGDLLLVTSAGDMTLYDDTTGALSVYRRGQPGRVVALHAAKSTFLDLPEYLDYGAGALRFTSDYTGDVVVWRSDPDMVAAADSKAGDWYVAYNPTAIGWSARLQMPRLDSDDPVLERIRIDWRYPAAVIDSIVDVPGDQGGYVRIHMACAAGELVDPLDVTAYNVYRRMDDPTLLAQLAEAIAAGEARDAADPPGLREVTLDGRRFLDDPGKQTGFPTGSWEVVAGVTAMQQETYTVLAPTLADSCDGAAPTVYLLSTHRSDPTDWSLSPPDSAFSRDNIAPAAPEGFQVDYAAGNDLAWLPSGEEDFHHFKIYRGDAPGFTPDPEAPLHVTSAAAWSDPDGDRGDRYLISAVDRAGNESEAVAPEQTTGAGDLPSVQTLGPAVPNPFNPRTRLRLDLPEAATVDLRVFDATGRCVRRLLDGVRLPSGGRDVNWDGRDDAERRLPTGLYFARLEAEGRREVRRMVLVK